MWQVFKNTNRLSINRLKMSLVFLHSEARGTTIDIERKNRSLKVCYVPTANAIFLAFFLFFLAVAINSTNEANKAGGTRH
jgi:hypothetical protein